MLRSSPWREEVEPLIVLRHVSPKKKSKCFFDTYLMQNLSEMLVPTALTLSSVYHPLIQYLVFYVTFNKTSFDGFLTFTFPITGTAYSMNDENQMMFYKPNSLQITETHMSKEN